jgi:HEAT repeat protein
MDLFGANNIEKMVAEHDMDGLYRLLEHSRSTTRLEAALALAEMNDGAGWRYLMDAVRQAGDPDSQAIAVSMLGDLGHPRAIPVLEETLKKTRGELADIIKEALQAIGGREADDALRRAGYEPVLPHMSGNQQLMEYEGDYVRAIVPDTSHIQFLTAEQHLNNAVELREAEMAERGLVEDSLALWLSPEWAYAWYLRGVLYEDLERSYEASLCYQWALEIEPGQAEAREALADLKQEHIFPPLDPDVLIVELASREWNARRDAAAGFGELGEKAPEHAVDRLVDLLDDEDREVRHAAIEALTSIGDRRAVLPLLQHEEGSWLLRFGIIEALAQLGSVDGLATVLRREMKQIQERNPVFSSHKDPLLEVEYDRLMEIGVLAFERAGNVPSLLDLVEGNAWEDVSSNVDADEYGGESYFDAAQADGSVEDEEDLEADEDLDSYVDEVAQMASLALERLATPILAGLDKETLRRLTAVPDLSLLDVTEDDQAEPQPNIIHDLSALREAAKAELARR